jgi:ABC-type nitrate/sulfonate/bicarbonate transport system substrate-binding protein
MTPLRALLAALVVVVSSLACPRAAYADKTPASVRIVVPKRGNLQFLSFWVAIGARLFESEGIAPDLVIPDTSAGAPLLVGKDGADVAVLPPPQYLQMIATGEPLVLVANLLQNDPINLVVRRTIFEERKMSASAPLVDRLKSIHGLKVGVAYGPPTRLRALFASQGLDADREIEIVNFHGREQNEAFEGGKVDVLYAHTPYVERALLDQDAVLLVNQSAGDVHELADRQIHALIVTKRFLSESPDLVLAMTRAIYRAQKMIHANRAATVDAVLAALPTMDRRQVELIVGIYEPAIPANPLVSTGKIQTALDLFPASKKTPDLSGVDLRAHVEPRFAMQVIAEEAAPPQRSRRWPYLIAAAVIAVGLVAWLARARLSRLRHG